MPMKCAFTEKKDNRILVLCSGLMMLLLSYFAWTTVYSSDDYWYSTFWDHGLKHYLELMDFHYRQFNGRTLVHALAHIVLHFDRWAFVVMCCALCGAVCFAMARGTGMARGRHLCAVCLFLTGLLCMPLQIFNQGVMWISASCNYFFPAALVCLLAAALERQSNWSYLLAFLCGATTEQMGLASVVLAAAYAVSGLLRRKGAVRNLSCTVLALLGALTIFLSPATARRADSRVHLDNFEMILKTVRRCILLEAEFLTANPAPLVVMLAILVMGAVVLGRGKGWKWPAVPAAIGGIMLLIGWFSSEEVRLTGFVAAFLALGAMAVLLMAGGQTFAGGLTLTGLASAAVMLPTNTIAARVMLPVYFLLLVSACVLSARVVRHRSTVAAAGLILAVLVSVPAVVGYWNNYQVDLMNQSFAWQDRDRFAVRYCIDYDMDYTWYKADFDPYFQAKYLESIGLPEKTRVAYFSRTEENIPIRCGDLTLIGSLRTEPDGTLMLPLREVIETMGGSVEWTLERRAAELDGVVLVLEPVGNTAFRVRMEDGREFMIDWCTWAGCTYCEAALFEEGFGIAVRMDPEGDGCYLEK